MGVIPTEVECAWAAGIFEGEGSLEVRKLAPGNRPRPTYALLCAVQMVEDEPVRELHRIWDGSLSQKKPYRTNRRATTCWAVSTLDALTFLRAIKPYVRREHLHRKIDLALEFGAQKQRGGRYSDEYVARQYAYYLQMREFNLRGTAALALAA